MNKMMKQRTCNIIMCCKGNCGLSATPTFGGPYGKQLNDVAVYMGRECDYPPEKYSYYQMKGILKTALADYFGVCDDPRFEILNLLDDSVWKEDYTIVDRIASLFSSVRVRGKDGNYVNGFSEDLILKSEDVLATRSIRTSNDCNSADS